jgi:hypothetical protein
MGVSRTPLPKSVETAFSPHVPFSPEGAFRRNHRLRPLHRFGEMLRQNSDEPLIYTEHGQLLRKIVQC